MRRLFEDLKAFCLFMSRVGGSSDVSVSYGLPEHAGLGGRYISFSLRGSPQGGKVDWGDPIYFWPKLQSSDVAIGGPFPLTEETLAAVAAAGVDPNSFGSPALDGRLRPIAVGARDEAVRRGRLGVEEAIAIEPATPWRAVGPGWSVPARLSVSPSCPSCGGIAAQECRNPTTGRLYAGCGECGANLEIEPLA